MIFSRLTLVSSGGFPQQSGDFLHHLHLVIDDFVHLLNGLLAQLAQLSLLIQLMAESRS
jgi:hypothetical protein